MLRWDLVIAVVRTALVVLVIALTAVYAAPSACACSCAERSLSESAEAATAIFSGSVVSTSNPAGGFSGAEVTYRVAVERVFKGNVEVEAVVTSAGSSASCGIEVTAGRTYLFFVQGAAPFSASLCGGTRPITAVPAELERVSPGRAPARFSSPTPTSMPDATPAADPSPEVGDDSPLMWVLAALGVLVMLGINMYVSGTRGGLGEQ